jgi:hypothetical protein
MNTFTLRIISALFEGNTLSSGESLKTVGIKYSEAIKLFLFLTEVQPTI